MSNLRFSLQYNDSSAWDLCLGKTNVKNVFGHQVIWLFGIVVFYFCICVEVQFVLHLHEKFEVFESHVPD